MAALHQAEPRHVSAGGEEVNDVDELFVRDIPFHFDVSEDGLSMAGAITMSDVLLSPNSTLPRPALLATVADCVAGTAAVLGTTPRLPMTLDIAVHMVAERCGGSLDVLGEITKQGRSTVASEIRFLDSETKELVASSFLTFMASPRAQDLAPLPNRRVEWAGSMPTPFPDYLGLRVTAPGAVEVDLTPLVLQNAGALQGGVIALLGEIAAASLTHAPILDLDVRYLSAVRVGPGHTRASLQGNDLVRVEVRDAGQDDRLGALIFVRVARTEKEEAYRAVRGNT